LQYGALQDGLTGKVVGPHQIARNWYKISLDPNPITPHDDWFFFYQIDSRAGFNLSLGQ
jgi:hypothetical protein